MKSRRHSGVSKVVLFSLFLFIGISHSNEPELIQFDFTVFGLHPGDFEGIHYLNPDGEPELLEFRRRHRSRSYSAEVEMGSPVRFFRIRGSGENITYEIIAEAVPEPSWSEMLFLFIQKPGSGPANSFTVYAATDDERSFPFGSLRVINLTGIRLGGSIDQRTETIPPGTWTSPFLIRRPGNVDVLFAAATSESVHLVYRRTMPLGMDSRTLLILRPPARMGSIRIGASTLMDFQSEEGDTETIDGDRESPSEVVR